MKYIGIDYHNQYFVSTVMNEQGEVISRARVNTDRNTISTYFKNLNSEGEKLKVVVEACYSWSYFYDQIKDLVDEVQLAHPLKTRAIAEARIKTDTIDSTILAHLLRADLIARAYTPEFETRDKRNLFRYRSSLVRMRTRLKNLVHSVIARNHIESKEFATYSNKFGKTAVKCIRALKLKGNDTGILNKYVDLIEQFDLRIKEVSTQITKTVRNDEICGLLRSVPGIADILSMAIRYEIDDIERFVSSKKLCSYAGLVPSTYSTGGITYQGRITKQGNRWLRWALVEAAHSAISCDLSIKQFYKTITAKRGKNRAKIAVARKLLTIIYAVWKHKRPYYQKPVAVAL